MSLDAVFRFNKQYFSVGETLEGALLLHPSDNSLVLKNGYLSLLVQEKAYHPMVFVKDHHEENVDLYPFYNLKYLLFEKIILFQTKEIAFKLLLPYNAPGTYNGRVASCRWYVAFDCDISKNGETKHFNINTEFAVFTKEYSIEI